MGFWNKLTARQRANKRERFEYIMNAINNITPGEASGTNYDDEIDSLKSRVAVLEGASDLSELIARIEALEENLGPAGNAQQLTEEEEVGEL